MITITRHMDGYDIARQIRMERQVYKKHSFLLLEGDTDIKRFDRYVDESGCSLVNCYGRKNAILATELLYEDGFPGALAVVDADFDRLTNSLKIHEGIVYSETHNLDLDWSKPSIVSRYLSEIANKTKCLVHGSAVDIIEKIFLGLRPISIARLLNQQKKINYKLSDIDAGKCFRDFSVDIDAFVDQIFEGKTVPDTTKKTLKGTIVSNLSKTYDLWQLTNGHDFHCALGTCLRSDLGERAPAQTWGKEIASHLRLTCDSAEFKAMAIYLAIRDWTTENIPFRILRTDLM